MGRTGPAFTRKSFEEACTEANRITSVTVTIARGRSKQISTIKDPAQLHLIADQWTNEQRQ